MKELISKGFGDLKDILFRFSNDFIWHFRVFSAVNDVLFTNRTLL